MKNDPNDKDYPINPSYCEVCENAIVAPRGNAERIFKDVYLYSRVENNRVYSTLSEAKVDGSSYEIASDSAIYTDIAGFAPIPTDKIGRLKV